MARIKQLSEDDKGLVTVGDALTYKAGDGDYHIEAEVTVVAVYDKDCQVRIDEVTHKGDKRGDICRGREIPAPWSYLWV